MFSLWICMWIILIILFVACTLIVLDVAFTRGAHEMLSVRFLRWMILAATRVYKACLRAIGVRP